MPQGASRQAQAAERGWAAAAAQLSGRQLVRHILEGRRECREKGWVVAREQVGQGTSPWSS